jgi:sortase (surface protein transpeptidase)
MSANTRMSAVAVLGLTVVAVVAFAQRSQSSSSARPAMDRSAVARPAAAAESASPAEFYSDRTYDTVAEPVRLRIPALHVDSKVDRLGLQADGSVQVPARTDVAGWYKDGPRPGQPGPAVILGHVDSHTGPGVFIDLDRIRPGATVLVDRADGSQVTFKVTRIERVPKVQFPTDLVYAPTLDPTLRLVTCGGSFDRSRGSYRDNVIAFADPA